MYLFVPVWIIDAFLYAALFMAVVGIVSLAVELGWSSWNTGMAYLKLWGGYLRWRYERYEKRRVKKTQDDGKWEDNH